MDEKQISYIINELGEAGFAFNPVSVPIYQTSIFAFDSFAEFKQALAQEDEAHLYTRGNNPTVAVVEQKLAALEGGAQAKLFAAGVGAIAAAIMAFVRSGDHVVCVRDCYSWTRTLLAKYLERFQVTVTFVDGCDVAEWETARQANTKVFYLESPTTFMFALQDLQAVAELARRHQIKTIIDNSWATPYFQNPLEFGIDIVAHSCSKYIGGHSDVIGGVLIGSQANLAHIFNTEFLNIGSVPGPFESWLLLRGLRTLPLRMRQHHQNTALVLEFLSQHPNVAEVFYPFHPTHPQVALARKQMRGGSGLCSFRLKTTDLAKIAQFTDKLQHFRRAVSWGGYESLVVPFAVTSGQDPQKVNVVRLHIGLEAPELLIEDLAQALAGI